MADDRCGRRDFLKLCGGAAAWVAATPEALASGERMRPYERALLVDETQRPFTAARLQVGETYIFHYPYLAAPCFLLDIGHPARGGNRLTTDQGETYQWQGGVGPNRSIVAFSAICAHQMSHPARSISFINYRHEPTRFVDSEKQRREQPEIIYCCSEKSVYDVSNGARVLGGPAPQPLAAIELEYDPQTDHLHALGTRGGEMFDRFFNEFGFRLMLDYGTEHISRTVSGSTVVQTLRRFSRHQRLC